MIVKQVGLNNLKSGLESDLSNLNASLNKSVNSYVTLQNEIWRSKSAKSFANMIYSILELGTDSGDSINTAIKKFLQNINSSVQAAVRGHNQLENESVSWSQISINVQNCSALVDNLLPDFEEEGTGVVSGRSTKELKAPLSEIKGSYNNFFDEVKSTISSNNSFDGAEKEALVTSITNINNKLNNIISNLANQLNTAADDEDTVHVDFSKQVQENFSDLSNMIK